MRTTDEQYQNNGGEQVALIHGRFSSAILAGKALFYPNNTGLYESVPGSATPLAAQSDRVGNTFKQLKKF